MRVLPSKALAITAALTTSMRSSTDALDAELEFNYLRIADVRTDPIITRKCLSDHVHTYYGPPKVRPETTTRDLLRTKPSQHSGLVKENKSLYWHPSIYKFDTRTGMYSLVDIYYASVYYNWDTELRTEAFPKGFRMIANDPNAFTECVVGEPFGCGRSDGCETDNAFFPAEACRMLEVTMEFPSCWDGRRDSRDHMSHVAYTDEDDECDAAHPKRIQTVSLSVYIKNYEGGFHTFSDGSGAFHADYLAGWKRKKLRRIIKGCARDVEECHATVRYKRGGATGCDTHDEKHDKLVAVQPPPLDTRLTVAAEAVDNVKVLPRGNCTGELLPLAAAAAEGGGVFSRFERSGKRKLHREAGNT